MLSGHVFSRELVQARHVGVERPVREEAEHAGHDDRVVEPPLPDVRLADERRCSAIGPLSKRPSIAASADRLVARHQLRLADRRSETRPARSTTRPAMTPTRRKRRACSTCTPLERVVGADGRHHERRR